MKIPIILISTKGNTKEQLLKESKEAIGRFLKVKREVEQKKAQQPSNTREHWFVKALEGGVKNARPERKFLDTFRKGKAFHMSGLTQWLRDAEQIPDDKKPQEESKTSSIKTPFFLKTSDGIFKVSEENGMLFAEMYDKSSKSFVRSPDVSGILEEGIEITPPTEIAKAPSTKR